jgi:hypothetical protein
MAPKINGLDEMVGDMIKHVVSPEGGASGAVKGAVVGAGMIGLGALAVAAALGTGLLAPVVVSGVLGGLYGASKGSEGNR